MSENIYVNQQNEISFCIEGVIVKEWKGNWIRCREGDIVKDWNSKFTLIESGRGGFKDIDYKSYQPENFVIDIEIGNCGWKHICKPT